MLKNFKEYQKKSWEKMKISFLPIVGMIYYFHKDETNIIVIFIFSILILFTLFSIEFLLILFFRKFIWKNNIK
jgi:hypothetical protein